MAALIHFTVSQVRVAATCPRILYFDLDESRRRQLPYPRVTQIWTEGNAETTALGTTFHNAIEKFNASAAKSNVVAEVLQSATDVASMSQAILRRIYRDHVNRDTLFAATGPQQEAFIAALRQYISEVANLLAYGRSQNLDTAALTDLLFGDNRRRVDVTFYVGVDDAPVHITGILDYVFFDWRTDRRRIIDYKLTPGHEEQKDLFQVCLYAMMHHIQHRTEPDAGVLYLHPQRHMVEISWQQIRARQGTVFDLLASMAAWSKFDEQTGEGLRPPGDTSYCSRCPWRTVCEARLGPKSEGKRCTRWTEAAAANKPEPKIERRDPPQVQPEKSDVLTVEEAVGDTVADVAKRERQELTPRNLGPTNSDSNDMAVPPDTRDDGELAADLLWLGQSEVDKKARIGMPRDVLATHTAVVGAAGSGKTWLAKGIVEEAILQGIPVLAVDPQGDLVQFLRQANPEGLPTWECARFERYQRRVETRVFTPGSWHATRLCLNPLRLPRMDQLSTITDPLRRMEEFEGMLTAAADNLTSLAGVRGETVAMCTLLVQLLRALCKNGSVADLSIEDIVAGIRAPDTLGINDPDALVRKTDRDKLARSLNGLLLGPASQLFRDGIPLDLERMCQPLTAGKTPLNVLYLNALPDDHQKQFFVASLAAEIYRWMVTRPENRHGVNLLFYIDEARDFIPAGARNPPAKSPLIRLFTQGRKYGVGCLLCTQSPRSVDYNVFGNCSTKIIGRLESQQDVERVGEWFANSGGTPAWLPDRKTAEKGSFVGRWPGIELPTEGTAFRSRPLFSLHGGAWSPDRVERETADDPFRAQLRPQT